MKKRQEEINKKIALLKNKEDNINRVRKENTVQKRVITSFLENQRKNLIIKRQFIENRKQIDNLAAKEGAAVLEGWLVYDDYCTFRLDTFHHSLNARLAEIVAVRLHCESIDTDDGLSPALPRREGD